MVRKPPGDVDRLLDEIRAERRQFEAFIRGYANGYADRHADKTFESQDDFEARVTNCFEQDVTEDVTEAAGDE